jgi:hypothetical protein
MEIPMSEEETKTPEPKYIFTSPDGGNTIASTPINEKYQSTFSFMSENGDMISSMSEPTITYNGQTITAGDNAFPAPFQWRYGEGSVLDDLRSHIESTYTSHYTNKNDEVQTLDVFAHRGTLGSTSIDNAIKYLMRYGKKDGKNEKDLIKAMHYLVLATAYERKLKKT